MKTFKVKAVYEALNHSVIFLQEQVMLTKDTLFENMDAVKRKYEVCLFLGAI